MASTAYAHLQVEHSVVRNEDGSLGYSDGKRFNQLYGQLQLASDVPRLKVKISRKVEKLTRFKFGLENTAGVEHIDRVCRKHQESSTLDNVLFKYEEAASGREVTYVKDVWNNSHSVRRLHPNALCGRGAMLESIKDRVYVLDSSIPHEKEQVRRGYLKVEGSQMVSIKVRSKP